MPAVDGGMVGGGELLRAVMDAAAIGATYALYTVLIATSSATAQGQPKAQKGSMQMKSDCWFLCTGIFPQNNYGTAFNEVVNLTIGSSSASLTSSLGVTPPGMTRYLWNETLASRMTLGEYLLFPPAEIINVDWFGQVNQPFVTTPPQTFGFVCLEGIEYRF